MRSFAFITTISTAMMGTTLANSFSDYLPLVTAEPAWCDPSTSPTTCAYTPKNTLDGSLDASSRWWCQGDSLDDDDEGCWIRYIFREPQDVVWIRIAFHQGNENTRTLDVYDNGVFHSQIESSGETLAYQVFVLTTVDTDDITLRLADAELHGDVWLGITEVNFFFGK